MRERLKAMFGGWATERLLDVVGPLVPQTLLPVLRCVSGDPTRVDREYAKLLAQREPLRFRRSRRARSRQRLSVFARELSWVCRELEHYMSRPQYEALVTGTVARMLEERVSHVIPSLIRFLSGEAEPGAAGGLSRFIETELARRVGVGLLRRLEPASFVWGDVELRRWSAGRGELELWVRRCELRALGSSAEEGERICSRICKGASEAVLGDGAPLRAHLRPTSHGSCEVRLQWDAPNVRRPPPRAPTFVPERALLRRRQARPSQMWN